MANDLSVASEPARWIKLRASAAERARWQALAASRGVSLSELIRASLGGLRLRTRREPPLVAPELLRELARIGNNLNQLARAANRQEPVTATALLARLIAIERELRAIRAAQRGERAPDLDLLPGLEEGLAGMRFIDACVRSAREDAAWVTP